MSHFSRCLRGGVLFAALVLVPACQDGDDGAPGAAGPSIPVIQSLSAQGLPAPRSGAVTLTVQAQSPEGLTLSYSWSTSPPTWVIGSGGSTATVSITAPNAYGESGTATVVVTDSAGRSGTGLVALSTVGNSAPIIHTINASPNPVPLPRTLTVSATASDPNGDTLAYTWTVPSGFAIAGGQGTAQISVTATAIASGDISVSVSDGGAPAVIGSLFVSSRHGWGLPVSIESGAAVPNAPLVAMNESGEVMAVWIQSDGVAPSVWANRFTPAGGWGTAQTIETGSPNASSPEVVIDAAGNAIAVWFQSDGVSGSVWANRFTPGGGWGAAVLLESSADSLVNLPRLTGSSAGDAFVIWSQDDAGVASIWANRFTIGGGWEGAITLESSATPASWPHVAMNASGRAMAVWRQPDLVARRYVPGPGWEAPATIGTTPLPEPEVAMSANGEAVAVWRRNAGGLLERRWANRFTPPAGWGTETTIDAGSSDVIGPAMQIHVAMDDFGFAIAIWNQGDGMGSLTPWSNRGSSSGWEAPVKMQVGNQPASTPRVAMAPTGEAFSLWNSSGVRVSRFTPLQGWEALEVVSPTGFSGSVALNSFGDAVLGLGDSGNAFAVHFR